MMLRPELALSIVGRSAGPEAAGRTGHPLAFRGTNLLRLSLAVLLTGQLGRIPIISGDVKEAPLLLNDALVMIVVAALLITVLRTRRLVLDETSRLSLLFAAIGGVSAVLAVPRFGLSVGELVFSLAYLARWVAYFAVYVAAINWLARTDIYRMWRTVEAMVLVFAGFGILQSAFLPGFAQMVFPDSRVGVDWDYQGHRLVSTFLDPNFAGVMIAMVIAIQLALLAAGHQVELWKLVILGCALILTVSRSSVLSLLIGVALMTVGWGISRRVLRLSIAVALLMVPLLPWVINYAVSLNKFTVDASALTRVVSWLMALRLVADNPLIGVGFNTIGFVQRAYGGTVEGGGAFGFDGGLLFVAVVSGILGLSVYSLMVVRVLKRCGRLYRDEELAPFERGLALGVASATVILVFHSLFVNSIVYPFLMHVTWVLWAMVAVLARSAVSSSGGRGRAESSNPAPFRLVS
jgi:hypothetical protein